MADKKPSGKAARRRKAKEMEQPELPGADTPRNEKVHAAALFLIDKKAEFGLAGEELHEAQGSLIEIMKKEEVTTYHYGKLHVILTSEDKVTVKEDKERKQKTDE
jgi:hypothetical protein